MPKTDKPLINLALAAITQDIVKIAKDRKNEQQGFRFRGIDDVYNSLHPIFAAHGVVCIPTVETLTQSPAGQTSKGTPITRSVIMVNYQFTADDGSFQIAKICGEGLDSADKGTAKALSAAHKYLLIQTFLVPTADIADGGYDPTADPRSEIEEQKDGGKRKAILSMIEDKRACAKEAATDADRDRLNKEADDLEAELNGEPAPGVTKVECRPIGTKAKEDAEKAATAPPAAATPPPANEPPPAKDPAPAAPPKAAPAGRKKAGEEKKPAEPQKSKLDEYVITQVPMRRYLNRRIDDMQTDELLEIKTKWVDKYRSQMEPGSKKEADADAIDAALEERQKNK